MTSVGVNDPIVCSLYLCIIKIFVKKRILKSPDGLSTSVETEDYTNRTPVKV